MFHFPESKYAATYPLEDLLPSHVLQPAVQIPNLLRQIIDLALVRALDLARLSNRQIQRELYTGVYILAEPGTALLHILWNHADSVLAAVSRAESKLSGARAALGYHAVVVVECLFDGDEDSNVRFGDVVLRIVVPHFGIVVACIPLLIAYVEGGQTWVEGRGAHTNYQRVLWKLFEEALLDCAIHKEVQCL